ncbi:MAG: zf-HC2 domain-containing protein [Pyrinomonadaceae bacterium]|nr:zf-HC2 domain-containing protein [Pyrinomonadaceae bacterium]
MICRECLPLLDLYLDRELSQPTTDLVHSHLSACPSCASTYEKLRREQDLYLGYKCDGATDPSFWNDVLRRVAEQKVARTAGNFAVPRRWLHAAFGMLNAPRFSPTLTALLVLAAIGLTVGVMKFTSFNHELPDRASVSQGDGAVVPSAVSPSKDGEMNTSAGDDRGGTQVGHMGGSHDQPPGGSSNRLDRRNEVMSSTIKEVARRSNRKPSTRRDSTTDELIRDAERKYVAAIALLSHDANRRRSRLDPETEVRFKETLAAIDRTINGTRRAVREHPDDPVAVQYMLTAYAKKVEVLREMIGN